MRHAGHEVYTPTLTGLGERAHLARPEVGLATHVEDVAAILEYEDLSDVILVGHSYSGMVIAGVAHKIPRRIGRLVYLDAFVPEDGQSLSDIKGHAWIEWERKQASASAQSWLVPPPSSRYFDVVSEADMRWADARLTPQPIRTFEEPIRLANPQASTIPSSYIVCTKQEDGFEQIAAEMKSRGWQCFEIAAGHDAMITAPAGLAAVLLALR